mgnify:CR=1 FL=1
MRISDFAVRNVPFMLVAFALMVALGISAWLNISRTEDPHFPISAFSVVAVYPGADPQEVERQVVEPIEDAIHTLDDVKHIFSASDDSLGIVRVQFHAGIDADEKFDELQREIDAIAPDLPDALTHLEIKKINPGLVNIVQYALVSDSVSMRTLEDLAEVLKDRLERIGNVREAAVTGVPPRELRVELDLARLAELKLRAVQVLDAIRAENTNVPGGSVETTTRRFNIKTGGAYDSPDEVLDTVIVGDGARAIRVRDIAQVRWDEGAPTHVTRFDGRRAIFVTANQKTGGNIFNTQDAINVEAEAFRATLPAGVELVLGFEQAKNVDRRLSRLGLDFAIAVLLVAITLLPLGLRAAGIVMISLPLSLLCGLAALYWSGVSLNQLSIAGFVVALGLLVDDSIVVTENIARFLRMGHPRDEAAMRATRQISLAILGCTAALLLAFLPLLALPGDSGKFIRALPLAVVYTVLASLLVALTIIPFLASRLMPSGDAAHEPNAALRFILRMIERVYAPWLHKALAHPKRTVAFSTLAFLASFALVPLMGLSVFPKADTPQFLVEIKTPNGSSLGATDAVLREVENVLHAAPEIRHTLANLGHGNPQIYYNIFTHENAANYAEIFVQLHEYDPQDTPAFYDRLREQLDEIPGAEILVKEFEAGPPLDAPIAMRLIGPDLAVLRSLAARTEALMNAKEGLRDVSNPLRRSRIDLTLNVDAGKAGLLGVLPLELDRTVRLAVAGISAGDFHEPDGDKYPIVLRAPMQKQPSPDTLQGLHVGTLSGAQVPLAQITRLELSESPSRISRYDRERSVTISAFPASGYNTEAMTHELLDALAELDFPPGYRFEAGGELESRKDSFAGFGPAILVALFGIMAVLVLEFGSFRSTLIVFTVIPLGVMGGIVMLFLCGYTLSFVAIIGFIALIGIEIKNSILLVDFTNQLRAQGKPLDEAIAEAGEVRFLPILLTSVTAIGGLLPLALQNSPLYSPMALVIIGGLISSTLIGRLVTPAMYKLLPPPMPAPAPRADV